MHKNHYKFSDKLIRDEHEILAFSVIYHRHHPSNRHWKMQDAYNIIATQNGYNVYLNYYNMNIVKHVTSVYESKFYLAFSILRRNLFKSIK